ncbi:YidC/Oxa1 family membrane protein insertase [Pilibacter termitis]|uniref:Membrane protein insertase YidC n=1 Tax=Pilibacter termitis TaxID=263852 RepID=A0A1T4R8K8_9ENTE|nr:membrane protein insertase YidC [Pilibacter termitis]SKA12008.1 YidC/Oxa1 family membrane protein insertase [Pilibacter termitis]
MKKIKKLALSTSAIAMLFLLTGCVQYTKSGNPTGIVYDFLGKPMVNLIELFAKSVGYGWAIVLITIIVRIVIFPLGISQSKKMTIQQEKMSALKPALEPIQAKMKNATTPEEKMQANAEMQQVYKDNNMSLMGGMGCLPLLIQMPIFSALYVAARYAPGIQKSAPFYGIDLTKPSMVLLVIVGIFYFIQGYASLIGMPEENKQQMKTMSYMTPIMMIFFMFSSPAGVGLYWTVGGLFALAQTLFTNLYLKPKIKRDIAEELERNPIKIKTPVRKDVTTSAVKSEVKTIATNTSKGATNGKGRNAGKQRRNKN